MDFCFIVEIRPNRKKYLKYLEMANEEKNDKVAMTNAAVCNNFSRFNF